MEAALEALHRELPIWTLAAGFTQLDSAMYRTPVATANRVIGEYIQTAWVDVDGSFADYWEARGKNLKQNIRKQRRKLLDDGVETRLEVLREPDSVAAAVEDYGKLESSGWKGNGRHGHPSQAMRRAGFTGRCSSVSAQAARGCVYRYRFSGRAVAVDLCIESDDTLVILKTTYDESIQGAVARLPDAGGGVRPHLAGRDGSGASSSSGKVMDWHKRWTDNARDVYHLTNYRWSWVKRLRARAVSAGARAG